MEACGPVWTITIATERARVTEEELQRRLCSVIGTLYAILTLSPLLKLSLKQ